MPSGKDRSKEDTWKESDLKKALKDDKKKPKDESRKSKEHSSRKSEPDKRERKDKDDDRKRRGHDDDKKKRKETSERSKDSERSKETLDVERSKERDRSRERRKEKESGDKEHDRDRRRERDAEKSKDKERGRDRSDRNGERDRSRDRRKEKSGEDRDRERRKEKEGEKRGEAERRERSRDRDTSKERRKERDDKDRGKDKTKDRDRDKDRERRKERDRLDKENKDSDKDDRRRSDRDSDRRKDRSKNEDGSKERRHDDRKDERRERKDDRDRHKEKSEESNGRDKEDKIKRREKEMMQSLKKEEELKKNPKLKFRSDTVEEADTIDEDVEQKRKASLRRMSSTGAAEEIHDEENDGYDYEDDDFEDYDDDFEDDADEEGDDEEASIDVQDHSGMQELLQAINAENQDARASSREGREETKEHSEPSTKEKVRPTTGSRGRINFVAAKQKQITDKVASRTRRRGQELMHLIDLDVAVFDIFDLPPLNEYELYIKNFGRSDTKQAYVQCNEDNVEKEVQTEEIETRTKWTQNPASDSAGFGDDEDDLQEDLSSLTEKANIDSLRLSKFLQRATQTCLILLEENISEQANTQFKERKDMTCSDGFIQLATKHVYLEGRPVKCVHISPVQTHFVLVAYGPVKDQSKVTSKIHNSIQEKGLVCFWNTNEPSEPQKVLICESTPMCCCLSPSKATLAFAGLEDGSLVAWDLRESSLMHYFSRISVGDNEIILRPPTFSTAGVLKKTRAILVQLCQYFPSSCLVTAATSARASGGSNLMSDDMLGLSFQLATLEENAAIYLWVVVELDRANSAGSESDLGLSPGGKIKLMKSSSISLQSPFRDFRSTMSLQALIMRFLPHDPNHIYVGTDGGYVLHCERHGGRAPPKAHRPVIENLVNIASLDLSPWQLPCMLAGSEDGNLWLFNLKNELPLLSWSTSTGGSGILSVQWSRSKPSVFYVLDSNSNLHIWDLLKSDQGPVSVETFKHGRVACFELSSDYSASGIGIPGRNPELVLVYESGAVEIHKLSTLFSRATGDELDTFASYLDRVI
ncbi:hypothetical protein OS493_006857 [Desmophyllum pertusum]|uniref:WD repeat-containing protein 60 n=1 Tax=Desmophyllum pertusum TaxID=174260 RepID=A0A9W9ZS18_9CNID|nr:hypothetical protein OS493_006857 [Desmophyllum pertusum]